MSRIYQGLLDFAVDAYAQLKDVPREEGHRSAWYEYRYGDERIMQFLMIRTHTYFGEWAMFEHGTYVASFDSTTLARMHEEKEAARKAKADARNTENCSEKT